MGTWIWPQTFLSKSPSTPLARHLNLPNQSFFLSKLNKISPFLHWIIRRVRWENWYENIQHGARCIVSIRSITFCPAHLEEIYSLQWLDMVSKWLINDCPERISLSLHLLTFCKGRQTGLCQVLSPILSKLALDIISSTCSSEVRNRSVHFVWGSKLALPHHWFLNYKGNEPEKCL